MYQNKHGRFTAPDPLLASASAANPQTFNRYIYTGNNPVNITDPSGLKWCGTGGNGNGVDDIQWFKDGVCSGEWKDLNLDIAYSCNIGPCTLDNQAIFPQELSSILRLENCFPRHWIQSRPERLLGGRPQGRSLNNFGSGI
ncbi:MAG: hypothetical protein JNK51_00675 [Blastocatellia bacterium]|nr:hypothetical protein [Blastocatellia bacterium]